MDESKINQDKYGGGNQRIQNNNKKFIKLARKYDCTIVDSYALLEEDFSNLSTDGVHLNEKAQFSVAKQLVNQLMTSTPAP
ncbi:lysophospholipase L1-like esterase [Catalinimonas alkaloidigena]|uniref:hypothetical protein n=1 Tax=Catalinimonas alkaloidigena TaxID=1075417 RepID=UPI002405E15B|nr:hypothetical protein [Catalinimonas alkaloidigena]MDF9798262.1 lysophospholipase L1-like esterase [Catalinimonas alkaloidigena]